MTETIAARLADASTPLISFEFFPPKDPEGYLRFGTALGRLEPLRPDFVSVTYGATGSNRDRTFEITSYIKRQTTFETMGHLTCAGQSVAEVTAAVDRYAADGIRHVLAVRGDPAGGSTARWQPHAEGLATATELVRLVKARGDFCVGVAAFPDGHPENHDLDLDAQILLAKQEAGAEFAITQLFFSAESYFSLVDRVRAVGGTLPIIAGIMPVTNLAQLERFARLSGAELPDSVVSPLRAVADDPAAVRRVGVDLAVQLGQELLAGGVPGLQFFTQNRARATTEILTRLRATAGPIT